MKTSRRVIHIEVVCGSNISDVRVRISSAPKTPKDTSFRDQCAIAAMSGLCDAYERDEACARWEDEDQLAITAFSIADAMDTERQKRSAK